MMTSLGFSFRSAAAVAEAGRAGIGGGYKENGLSRSTVRWFGPTLGGFSLATDVETGFLDDAERHFAEDLGRLRLLLEASATLLGSLEVEAMLPEVLALAGRTLAADAYSVWQYDGATQIWSVGAYAGLSDEYVAAAMGAIRGSIRTGLGRIIRSGPRLQHEQVAPG